MDEDKVREIVREEINKFIAPLIDPLIDMLTGVFSDLPIIGSLVDLVPRGLVDKPEDKPQDD